jgi:NAD(P)-dependent dehydrogenase (short-subunit alcohol dehydrogenase family)
MCSLAPRVRSVSCSGAQPGHSQGARTVLSRATSDGRAALVVVLDPEKALSLRAALRGEGYRRMIELSPVHRAGTPDEVGTVGALLMGADGAFITGSDILVDGGVTASYFHGELAS